MAFAIRQTVGSRPATSRVPIEVWFMIIENIYEPTLAWAETEPQEPRPNNYHAMMQTLHSLCLTSRTVRELSQPFMYREFAFGYEDRERYKHQRTYYSSIHPDHKPLFTPWLRRLASLANTLLKRPDLAAQMTHVFLDPRLLHMRTEFEKDTTRLASHTLALARFDPDKVLVSKDNRQKYWSCVLLTLTLRLMPNLRHLAEHSLMCYIDEELYNRGYEDWVAEIMHSLSYSYLSDSELAAVRASNSWGRPKTMKKIPATLKSLELMVPLSAGWRQCFDANIYKWGIESLTIRQHETSRSSVQGLEEVIPLIDTVKNLRLLNLPLTTQTTDNPSILRKFTKLEIFVYASPRQFVEAEDTEDSDSSSEAPEDLLAPIEITTSLFTSMETLTHLHLDMRSIPPGSRLIRSFRQFKRLESLTISLNSVGPKGGKAIGEWLQSWLPHSLKSLAMLLAHFDVNFDNPPPSGIRRIITEGVLYPELKRVRWVHGNSPWFGEETPVLTENRFRSRFGEVDVEWVIEGMGPRVENPWVGEHRAHQGGFWRLRSRRGNW